MQNFTRTTLLVVSLICSPILSGCGGDKYGMVTAQGQVTYKGQPLKHGEISFRPLKTAREGVPFRITTGYIDSEGRYTLTTFKKDDGIMPGEYSVVVLCKDKSKRTDPEGYNPPSIIPERYSRQETTPFKATIEDGKAGPLTFDFKIEDK